MKYIFHIAVEKDWQAAKSKGEYWPHGREGEPFIHFSFAHQVCATAVRIFKGRTDLILLKVPMSAVEESVVVEPAEDGFPHLYRPLGVNEVAAEFDFKPKADGTFGFPQNAEAS